MAEENHDGRIDLDEFKAFEATVPPIETRKPRL